MKSQTEVLNEYGINIMQLNDDFNTQLSHAMERYAEEYYKEKVGALEEGQHPDEIHPHAETWLRERHNWQAETEALRQEIERLKGLFEKKFKNNHNAFYRSVSTMTAREIFDLGEERWKEFKSKNNL